MEIDFKEALERVKQNQDIESSVEEGYFLNSATAIFKPHIEGLDRWIITFYSPKEEEVVQGIITDEGEVTFKKSAKAIDPSTEEINLDKIELTAEEALEKTKEERKEQKDEEGGVNQVILSVKKDREKGEIWEVNLITLSFSLFQTRINASTGEVIYFNEESLIKGDENLPFIQ